MRRLKLLNENNGNLIADQVKVAWRFSHRLLGLMFTKSLPEGEALLIQPCRSIHTFFMNYSIDVLYLDANNRVAAVSEQMEPRKVGQRFKGTVAVVELPPGTIKETRTEIGQIVRFEPQKRSDSHVEED